MNRDHSNTEAEVAPFAAVSQHDAGVIVQLCGRSKVIAEPPPSTVQGSL